AAKADGTAAVPTPAGDNRDDAGLADARVILESEPAELVGYDLRGPMLLEAKLRMRVQVAAQRRQLGMLGAEIFDRAHADGCAKRLAGSVRRHQALDAQARIDRVVEQID